MKKIPPVALIILDGFGIAKKQQGVYPSDATTHAHMPFLRAMEKKYPYTTLKASGPAVGLPSGIMGNSEVGHLTIGAGRVIPSILERFSEDISSGAFFQRKDLISSLSSIKPPHRLHILTLLSDAGVHSFIEHLYAFLCLAKKCAVKNVFLHLFLDGRDMPKQSALALLKSLQAWCLEHDTGAIASIHGRFFAMDRDHNWGRTELSYKVLTERTIVKSADPITTLEHYYQKNIDDEYIPPTQLLLGSEILPNDTIACLNIRPERTKQLISSLLDPTFDGFKRATNLTNAIATFITPISYNIPQNNTHTLILFSHTTPKNTLLDVLSRAKITTYCIAETEKFAHVTYFFRGETTVVPPFVHEQLIPSLKEKNYITHPEMSARQITNIVQKDLHENIGNFYVINYANADMVGHAGNFEATTKACSLLDVELEKLYQAVVIAKDGTMFITADHGNAEHNQDPMTGKPLGMHTTNHVPFLAIGKSFLKQSCKTDLGLAHIAPTILHCFGLAIPPEMVQVTIVERSQKLP